LREASGLCALADGRLVVADTSHHRLVVLAPDGAARVLEVTGTIGRDAGALSARDGGTSAAGSADALLLPPVTLGVGDVTLRLRIEPPAGFDLAAGSRVSVRLAAGPPLVVPAADQGFVVSGGRPGVPILLRSGPESGESEIEVSVETVVCRHGDAAACFPVRLSARLGARVAADGPAAAAATLVIPPPA